MRNIALPDSLITPESVRDFAEPDTINHARERAGYSPTRLTDQGREEHGQWQQHFEVEFHRVSFSPASCPASFIPTHVARRGRKAGKNVSKLRGFLPFFFLFFFSFLFFSFFTLRAENASRMSPSSEKNGARRGGGIVVNSDMLGVQMSGSLSSMF